MKSPLKKYVNIQFGNYYKPASKGDIAYLQARNFDNQGRFLNNVDTFIEQGSMNPAHLLQDGDVLFVGKGFRTFAWCFHESFRSAVASSIFFVIRPKSSHLLPEYLAITFNLLSNQRYFQKLGAGSSIPSIRINELAEFPIAVLSLENQQKIIKLADLQKREAELTESLSNLKQQLFQAIAEKLIYQNGK